MARSQSSVARAQFHLPIDLQIDILSRLPVKSLLRSKSVCKTWYDLIESPTFIAKHLTRSTLSSNFNSTTFLLLGYDYETSAWSMHLHNNYEFYGLINLDFPILDPIEDLSVVGICNGLACLKISFNESLFLCNPATRQFWIIPDYKWWDDNVTNIEWFSYGFGFHPSADDYVLIRIVCHSLISDSSEILFGRADMYMMRSDTWRELDDTTPSAFGEDVANADLFPCAVLKNSVATFLNGILYWKTCDDAIIVSLDLCGQLFQKVEVPDSSHGNWWTLKELKDKLALINYAPGCEWFDVWLLNEDLRSWTHQFKVGPFLMTANPVGFEITLVGYAKSGELVLRLFNSDVVELYLYNPKSQEMKNLPSDLVGYDSYMYVETLLPVKRNNAS